MSIDSKDRKRKCLTEQTFHIIDSKDRKRNHFLFFMSIINLLGIIWRNDDDDDDGASHNSRVARYLIPKEVGAVPDQELLEDFTNSWVSRFSMTSWYNPHHPHHWQRNNVLSPGITNIDFNCFSFCAMNKFNFCNQGVFRLTSLEYTHKLLKWQWKPQPSFTKKGFVM